MLKNTTQFNMSDEPNSKRRKMNQKKFYSNQYKPKNSLEPGIRGFLATCNMREKDCVRECYNLLNEYADQVNSQRENEAAIESETAQSKDGLNDSGTAVDEAKEEEEEEEEDISTLLQKEIQTITTAKRQDQNRFQQVDTGVNNCIFIRTTVEDPNELGVRIIRDIDETKQRKTRTLLRFWPVDVVCRANIEAIKNAAGKLFDKVFLNTEPTTYSIEFHKRHHNSIDRMVVIHQLAELIGFKSSAHKVDLKNPKITVVIEVIKGVCCISLLPDYFKLKKYNVHELAETKDEKEEKKEKPAEEPKPSEEKTTSENEPDSTVSDEEQEQAENAEATAFEAAEEATDNQP